MKDSIQWVSGFPLWRAIKGYSRTYTRSQIEDVVDPVIKDQMSRAWNLLVDISYLNMTEGGDNLIDLLRPYGIDNKLDRSDNSLTIVLPKTPKQIADHIINYFEYNVDLSVADGFDYRFGELVFRSKPYEDEDIENMHRMELPFLMEPVDIFNLILDKKYTKRRTIEELTSISILKPNYNAKKRIYYIPYTFFSDTQTLEYNAEITRKEWINDINIEGFVDVKCNDETRFIEVKIPNMGKHLETLYKDWELTDKVKLDIRKRTITFKIPLYDIDTIQEKIIEYFEDRVVYQYSNLPLIYDNGVVTVQYPPTRIEMEKLLIGQGLTGVRHIVDDNGFHFFRGIIDVNMTDSGMLQSTEKQVNNITEIIESYDTSFYQPMIDDPMIAKYDYEQRIYHIKLNKLAFLPIRVKEMLEKLEITIFNISLPFAMDDKYRSGILQQDIYGNYRYSDYGIDVLIPTEEDPTQYVTTKATQIKDQYQPRLLTSDELDRLLQDAIPIVISADQEIGNNIRTQIISSLKRQLKDLKITPMGIDDLKREIRRRFEYARVAPNEKVGVVAAEALAGPITQTTLKTRHQAGSSINASEGISALKEMIDITMKRKNPSTTIYFKEILTFEEVADKRGDFVGSTVQSLITNFEIDRYSSLERFWWEQFYLDTVGSKVVPGQPSKYNIIRDPSGSDFPTTVLRLYFNTNLLYTYKITMDDIVNKLMHRDSAVRCIASPISVGIIDVYPIMSELPDKYKDRKVVDTISINKEYDFLAMLVKTELSKIKVKGISGITAMEPVTQNVNSIILDEEKVLDQEKTWRLLYNKHIMISSGISDQRLISLCEHLKMTVDREASNEDYLVVTLPDNLSLDFIENYEKYQESLDKNKRKKEITAIVFINLHLYIDEKVADERIEKMEPPTELTKYSQMVYAKTNGSNLDEVLDRLDVDTSLTYSNLFHEMYKIFGIEALRNYLIREFIEVLTNDGSYIDPRHIVLLVEFMTHQGTPSPISFTGISKHRTGPINRSTYQKAIQVLLTSAVFPRQESRGTAVFNIAYGLEQNAGTGAVDLFPDEDALREAEEYQRQISSGNAPTITGNVFLGDDIILDTPLSADDETNPLSGLIPYQYTDNKNKSIIGSNLDDPQYRETFFNHLYKGYIYQKGDTLVAINPSTGDPPVEVNVSMGTYRLTDDELQLVKPYYQNFVNSPYPQEIVKSEPSVSHLFTESINRIGTTPIYQSLKIKSPISLGDPDPRRDPTQDPRKQMIPITDPNQSIDSQPPTQSSISNIPGKLPITSAKKIQRGLKVPSISKSTGVEKLPTSITSSITTPSEFSSIPIKKPKSVDQESILELIKMQTNIE